MIEKRILVDRYIQKKKSLQEISHELGCSLHTIAYWMQKYRIPRRTHSEATYVKRNPEGDPFVITKPQTLEEGILFGMGLGLYWGEGTKADKGSIRLGNSDPDLIKVFIDFLGQAYGVKKEKLSFGLQIFSDISPIVAQAFWVKKLGVSKDQFYKTLITPSRGEGSYRKKLKYGVLTVYFCNKKLRTALIKELEAFGLKTSTPM